MIPSVPDPPRVCRRAHGTTVRATSKSDRGLPRVPPRPSASTGHLSVWLPRRPLVWRMTGKECAPASKAVRAVRFEARERRACARPARGGDRFGCSQSVADPPKEMDTTGRLAAASEGTKAMQPTNLSRPHAASPPSTPRRACATASERTGWPRPSCTNTGPEHAPCVRCPVGRTDGRTDVRGQWLG